MLQWMGGSRRKVTTTRRSTYNRQKQYFEQRKRKRQTTLCWDHAEKGINCTPGEGLRSLDILSLTSLTDACRAAHRGPCTESSGRQSTGRCLPEYDAHLQDEAGRQLNFKCDSLADEKLPLAASSDGNTWKCYGKNGNELAEREMHTFGTNRKDKKVAEHPNILKNNLSVLDVLNDDGPNSSHAGRPAHEDHAAFSVQGLGKIGTETPTKTPRKEVRTQRTCSTSRVKFCNSSMSKYGSILDDFGLEDNDTFLGVDDSEFASNSYGYKRHSDIGSKSSSPFDVDGFLHDGKCVERDYMDRPVPLAKRRSWISDWGSELSTGWDDQAIPKASDTPFCFVQERKPLNNWASPFEDIIHQKLRPLQESGDMVDLSYSLGSGSNSFLQGEERTNSSWLMSANLGTNETKHHEHLKNFDRTFNPMITVCDPLSVDVDEVFHDNNLSELRRSMPGRYKWKSGAEQCFENSLAFKEISKTNYLFPNDDNVYSSFGVPSLHHSSLKTSREDNAFVSNNSSFEGTNIDILEDSFLHSRKGWMDKKPVSKIRIDDDPFSKACFPAGKTSPLFSLREEHKCPTLSCYEDVPRAARPAEMTMGVDVARASSNESNFLSTNCRKSAIVSDNKSSVEDQASSSKLVSIAVPDSDDSKQEVASAETPEPLDYRRPEDSATNAKSPNSNGLVSLKPEHSVGNNLQNVSDAGAVVPSKCESATEIFSAEGINATGNSGDPANHVMLQSYVLQLLCVQKVLMSSSIQEPPQDGDGSAGIM